MAQSTESPCRLCGNLVPIREMHRHLCPICDEYVQHLALQTNRGIDGLLGDLQNGPIFRAASKENH
jgi:predicted ATP-grasp superfamily ATP-dependent carboligase